MSRGGGRWLSRAGFIHRRHGVGAKIGADGGGVNRAVKPAGVGIHCGGGGSICVRERRIGGSCLRVDAEGNLYVLNFEDDDSATEVAADGIGADTNATGVKDLPLEGPPVQDDDGAAANNQPPKQPSLVPTDKAEEMDLVPEVAARLNEVLANIDPIYHDVFVSMYKKFQC